MQDTTETVRQVVHNITITRGRAHAASTIRWVKDPCPTRNSLAMASNENSYLLLFVEGARCHS